MDWLNQDFVIEKIQSKINNLKNALYVAENGKDLFKHQKNKDEVLKYAEFEVKEECYKREIGFLESLLQDIDEIKKEEVRQFEQAEENIRTNKAGACFGI